MKVLKFQFLFLAPFFFCFFGGAGAVFEIPDGYDAQILPRIPTKVHVDFDIVQMHEIDDQGLSFKIQVSKMVAVFVLHLKWSSDVLC